MVGSGPCRAVAVLDTGVLPAMVPTTHPRLLATGYGHLINELHCSPANVLRSIVALLTGVLSSHGRHCHFDRK